MEISDDMWFELQFHADEASEKYGIPLPLLPSDDVQMSFTAHCGRHNLKQAFEFYRYVLSVCNISKARETRIMDFGSGWGRISRFFLRESDPDLIYLVDTMAYAIELLHATDNPCRIIHNQPLPPIINLTEQFGLIYSYSVFSHLSEEYFRRWVDYFMDVLCPGGYLVFTTNGEYFINHLKHLQHDKGPHPKVLEEHIRSLREDMPAPDVIHHRYLNGGFQFYPIGGAAELTKDFFGEAFIPRRYLEQNFGPRLVDFNENVPSVDQSVVVLRKPMHR